MNTLQAAFFCILLNAVLQHAWLHIFLCTSKDIGIAIINGKFPAKLGGMIRQRNGTDGSRTFGRTNNNMGAIFVFPFHARSR